MKKKILSFGTYLKFLFLLIFLFLLFISSVNYYSNPGNIYKLSLKNNNNKSSSTEFVKQLIKSENGILFNNDVWNIRDLKKSLVNEKTNADCAIIGSSRVMQISSVRPIRAVANICSSLINLGVDGTSLEDYLIISENLLGNNQKPKTILFGIDPWIFILNRDKRWRRHKYEFYLMKDRLEKNFKDQFFEVYYEKDSIFNKALLLNLINQEYFNRSIQLIFSKKNKLIEHAKQFNYEEGLEKSVILSDGSLIYSKKNLKKDFSSRANSTFNYDIKGISNNDFNSGKWYQKNAINLFNQLVVYLKKEFEVIFIITPYHPALWEVREQPLIKALIHLETKIYEMGKSLDVKVIGSFNPNKVNCKKGEFVDLVHPKDKCLIKALN